MADIDRVLDKVLECGEIKDESRQFKLLRYLLISADEAQRPVNEYSIAIDVLGRDQSFDPTIDSIVRTEMCRLRKALQIFNLKSGPQFGLNVDIPPKSYQPVVSYERRSGRLLQQLFRKFVGWRQPGAA